MSACASAEMLDLTMEFVSFFKSLMMRMNTKTIQLFITYEDMDREVNLLLYAWYLCFWLRNHDSFVRVKSMNILLNTLKPVTIVGEELGCIFFRRNSVYSGTFLSYPAELRFPMPPENGKGTKRNAKGMSSLPALQLIYIRISYLGLRWNIPSY